LLAGRITAPGRIELVEVAEPRLEEGAGKGDIIFQIEKACLCGSDTPYFDEVHPRYPLDVGHSLHEMIGTVVATNGAKFHAGDRVLAVPVEQRGLFERFRLSEERAIPLDPRPLPEHGLLAQPLGTVLFALKKIPHLLDLDVAIVGQGPIGQLFCAALRNDYCHRSFGVAAEDESTDGGDGDDLQREGRSGRDGAADHGRADG
jgi:threonine dehydrogenase-like Zn-dependent dehydrogenase